MKSKAFSIVLVLLSYARFSTGKSDLDLSKLDIPDDFLSKYMQKSVTDDLASINLYDRLVATPPHDHSKFDHNHGIDKQNHIKKPKNSLRNKRPRELNDSVDSMFNTLYSPSYTDSGSLSSQMTSASNCELNSEP